MILWVHKHHARQFRPPPTPVQSSLVQPRQLDRLKVLDTTDKQLVNPRHHAGGWPRPWASGRIKGAASVATVRSCATAGCPGPAQAFRGDEEESLVLLVAGQQQRQHRHEGGGSAGHARADVLQHRSAFLGATRHPELSSGGAERGREVDGQHGGARAGVTRGLEALSARVQVQVQVHLEESAYFADTLRSHAALRGQDGPEPTARPVTTDSSGYSLRPGAHADIRSVVLLEDTDADGCNANPLGLKPAARLVQSQQEVGAALALLLRAGTEA